MLENPQTETKQNSTNPLQKFHSFIFTGEAITRNNAFDFLRLALAFVVLIGHSYRFGNYGEEISFKINSYTWNYTTLGHIAVYAFFVLSGYFITQSASSSKSISDYVIKRIKRIFPAYWICILFVTIIATPTIYFLKNNNIINLFGEGYIRQITGTIEASYAGNFVNESVGDVMKGANNTSLQGSLWTIPFEIRFYLLIAIMMFFGLFRSKNFKFIVAGLWAVAFVIYSLGTLDENFMKLINDKVFLFGFAVLLNYFLAGSIAYLWRDKIKYSLGLSIICGLLTFLSVTNNWFGLATLFFGYFVISLGVFLPIKNLAKRIGDLSYGVYLYHWPIQSILYYSWFYKQGFLVYICSSIFFTFLTAFASWHLVEKRFLDR
jgi:peptidoglycan/LPS O-acetylase OafA/YrhL